MVAGTVVVDNIPEITMNVLHKHIAIIVNRKDLLYAPSSVLVAVPKMVVFSSSICAVVAVDEHVLVCSGQTDLPNHNQTKLTCSCSITNDACLNIARRLNSIGLT